MRHLNRKQAIAVRKEMFEKTAGGKILIAGMHLPFPGIGRLRGDGENTYTFIPIDYSPLH